MHVNGNQHHVVFFGSVYSANTTGTTLSGPLTSSTLPLWTVWSTLQSSEHQNDQTQKQFLSPSNASHEHLTLNVEHTQHYYTIIYSSHILIFISICTFHTCTYIIVYIVFLIFCILLFYYLCPIQLLSLCCTVELLSLNQIPCMRKHTWQ